MAASIGVIVGVRAEGRCLWGLDVAVGCSGARPGRARVEAARLIGERVWGLVSFGLAGGLAPGLAPGDLVVAEAVLMPDGRRIAADEAWRRRIVALVGGGGGTLAGSERLVASAAAKAALYAATSACAVDMESHVVAQAAETAGLPFVVVRAIADPSARAVPRLALGALGSDGEVRPAAVLGALLRRPQEVLALVRLGRDSARGFRTLRRVAALAAPVLAFR